VSISVHEHARGHGLRDDESEFARVSTVRKEAFAPAQQDRVDEQQNLVDQSLLEQHGRQRLLLLDVLPARSDTEQHFDVAAQMIDAVCG
jgi:hypothetical protein